MGRRTTYWATGVALLALLGLTAIPRHAPTTRISLNLLDFDGDRHPEILTVTQKGTDPAHVLLYATRGKFTHAMLDTPAHGPFTAHQDANGFTITGAHGAPALRGVYYRPPGKKTLPQLIVFGRDQARRYVWIDRGFLKLDQSTVIPGFSVGLLMLGDRANLLDLLGTRGPDDRFQLALAGVGPCWVHVGAHAGVPNLILGVRYDDERYVSTVGVRPGMTLTDVKKHYPGRRENNHWISPLYGLMGRIDHGDNVVAFTISMPWREAGEVVPPPKPAQVLRKGETP